MQASSLLTCVVVLVAPGIAVLEAQQIPIVHDLTVAISFKSPITLREPVIAALTIQNTSTESVRVDLGVDRKDGLVLQLDGPSGSTLMLPYRRENIDVVGSIGTLTIEPGEIYSQELLLNEWYDFREVGIYRVAAMIRAPGLKAKEAIAKGVDSVTGQLEVRPRNESQLRRRCQELVAIAITPFNYQEASDAALALSYVDDPVVVNYLKEILSVTYSLDPIVVRGLRRIGNADARAVLADSVQSDHEQRVALARDALRRLGSAR